VIDQHELLIKFGKDILYSGLVSLKSLLRSKVRLSFLTILNQHTFLLFGALSFYIY